MARFKLDQDIWECSCGNLNTVGRVCWKCGKTFADILKARKNQGQDTTAEQKKRTQKFREPAKEDGVLKSYFFPKNKN